MIAARLDLLDADSRDAIRRCSVVGRVFWPAAADVREHVVAGLAPRGLVTEHPTSSMAGLREFSFKHALTRDVAYASLPRPERRALHRRVGEWLLEVAPDRGVETAELAAYHYAEALAYGETSPAVSRRASELLATAGLAALQRGVLRPTRADSSSARPSSPRTTTRGPSRSCCSGGSRRRSAGPTPRSAHLDLRALARRARRRDAPWQTRSAGGRARSGSRDGGTRRSPSRRMPSRRSPASRTRPSARGRSRDASQLAMLRGEPSALGSREEALAVAERVGDAFGAVNSRINIASAHAMTGAHGAGPRTRSSTSWTTPSRSGRPKRHTARSRTSSGTRPGYLPVDDVVRVHAERAGKLSDLPRPPAIGLYVELSLAMMQLLPAGRWDEVDEILASDRQLAEAPDRPLGLARPHRAARDAPRRPRDRGGAPRASSR